jgi:hypothetical protein
MSARKKTPKSDDTPFILASLVAMTKKERVGCIRQILACFCPQCGIDAQNDACGCPPLRQ